jgi:hypothetical protein
MFITIAFSLGITPNASRNNLSKHPSQFYKKLSKIKPFSKKSLNPLLSYIRKDNGEQES